MNERTVSILTLEHEQHLQRLAAEKTEKERKDRERTRESNRTWWTNYGVDLFAEKFGFTVTDVEFDDQYLRMLVTTEEGITFYVARSSVHSNPPFFYLWPEEFSGIPTGTPRLNGQGWTVPVTARANIAAAVAQGMRFK